MLCALVNLVDWWIQLHAHMFINVAQWETKPPLPLSVTPTSQTCHHLPQKAGLHSSGKLILINISFNWVLSSYLFHGCVWNPVATKVEITQAGIEGSEKRLVGPRDCGLEGGKHVHELPTNILLEISLWKVGLDQGGHCCGVTLLYHILKKEENTLVNGRAVRSIFLLQDSAPILCCSITSGQT